MYLFSSSLLSLFPFTLNTPFSSLSQGNWFPPQSLVSGFSTRLRLTNNTKINFQQATGHRQSGHKRPVTPIYRRHRGTLWKPPLLDRWGAKANNIDIRSRTPPHYAAGGGLLAIVRLLLQHVAVDSSGHIALALVVEFAHTDVDKLLLSAKPGIFKYDATRLSQVRRAAISNHEILIEHIAYL